MFTGEKVAVLCGGDGREREVSLRSGAAVCSALSEAGFSADVIDLKKLVDVQKIEGYDGAFIAMHGDWGEGGILQEKLEEMHIPYTGSGPQASELAMNKWNALALFDLHGIKTPNGLLWPVSYDEVIAHLGRDVVVKPSSGGSTVGISILQNVNPLSLSKAAYDARQSYDSDVLVEKYIAGRELTAAVWEHNGKVEALPLIEIVPHHGFYDYANKYTAGATEYIVPAIISPKDTETISAMAVEAHKVLGCSGYSRADFRLSPMGEAYILEVNTAPGMTATSLVPKAANAAGVSMSEFVGEIMRMASCGK